MDFKRKELAKNAKKNLKKHYWLLVAVCLFAAFIGSEYTETMEAFKSLGTVNNEIQGAASVEANVDTVANSSVVSSVVQAMGAVITGDDDLWTPVLRNSTRSAMFTAWSPRRSRYLSIINKSSAVSASLGWAAM